MKQCRSEFVLFLWVLSVSVAPSSWSNGLGEPPSLGTAARDVLATFKLPPLRDRFDLGSEAGQLAEFKQLQVGRRARSMKLTMQSAERAWANSDETLNRARSRLHRAAPPNPRLFSGRRASEINALLRDPRVHAVKVTSARLLVDEAVTIRRAGLHLDLGQTELRAAANGPRFLIRIQNATSATVVGGAFMEGGWAVLVTGGRDVALSGGRYENLRGGGVVLDNTVDATVSRTRMTGMAGPGVLLHGDTTRASILDNEIANNHGSSNWSAAIVVTDRIGNVSDDPAAILGSDRYWAIPQPIPDRVHVPHGNVIAFNHLALNASSGIYSDGGIENVLFDNLIEGNSKEGICLDNGSTANVLAANIVRLNGKRWGKTDDDLRMDFVAGSGRLADGSAASKTPGISIDNAAYNIVYGNQIDRNYGGGVKMVRTSFFNVIGLNLLTDNNQGVSTALHYFGIELGAAPADGPAGDLDFTPSSGNIVFGNSIRGTHYAGIFYGPGSVANDTFDNSIFGATHWSMEQVGPQPNPSLNNLTNLPARNIDVGLGPEQQDQPAAR